MQEIMKEYGPALITVVAIIALIGIVSVVVGDGTNGVIGPAFTRLIEGFFEKATAASGV
jgi:dolichol kinase